jgi:hypothetical protein
MCYYTYQCLFIVAFVEIGLELCLIGSMHLTQLLVNLHIAPLLLCLVHIIIIIAVLVITAFGAFDHGLLLAAGAEDFIRL